MNHPHYEVRSSVNSQHYTFVSEGPKGKIVKLVDYFFLPDLGVWNLGFGDYNWETGQIDDQIVSDNGDGRKVLATVVFTLINFFDEYPNETVIFTGSTNLRTQVYGRIIANYFQDFSAQFVVKGLDESFNEYPFNSIQQFAAFQIKRVN
jgi:hypothetical protein